jgi:cobalt-zinc-cadmium efflux system protein
VPSSIPETNIVWGGGMSDRHGGHTHLVTVSGATERRRLGIALALLVAFLVGEVVAAVLGHSVALLADAGHMLTDAGALAASLVAARYAARPPSGAMTFGFRRAEVLSAQANGVTLLVAAALLLVESIRRLVHPAPVSGATVVVVASVGVVVNLVCVRILTGGGDRSINVEGSLRHLVTDVYAFVGTIVAGVVVITTGFDRADPIASLVIVGLMLVAAWQLLVETGRVLLEAAPAGADPAVIAAELVADPRVESLHDVHVWLISTGFPAFAAHVLVDPGADCHAVRQDLERLLHERHGIEHTTLQVDHSAEQLLTIERRTPDGAPGG